MRVFIIKNDSELAEQQVKVNEVLNKKFPINIADKLKDNHDNLIKRDRYIDELQTNLNNQVLNLIKT